MISNELDNYLKSNKDRHGIPLSKKFETGTISPIDIYNLNNILIKQSYLMPKLIQDEINQLTYNLLYNPDFSLDSNKILVDSNSISYLNNNKKNIGAISDTHISKDEKITLMNLMKAYAYYDSQNINVVIHLGDALRSMNEADKVILKKCYQEIKILFPNITTYFIDGNHDRYQKQILNGYSNFKYLNLDNKILKLSNKTIVPSHLGLKKAKNLVVNKENTILLNGHLHPFESTIFHKTDSSVAINVPSLKAYNDNITSICPMFFLVLSIRIVNNNVIELDINEHNCNTLSNKYNGKVLTNKIKFN